MQKDYDRQFNLQKAALVARGQDLKKPEGKKLLASIRRQVLEDMINFVADRRSGAGAGHHDQPEGS